MATAQHRRDSCAPAKGERGLCWHGRVLLVVEERPAAVAGDDKESCLRYGVYRCVRARVRPLDSSAAYM